MAAISSEVSRKERENCILTWPAVHEKGYLSTSIARNDPSSCDSRPLTEKQRAKNVTSPLFVANAADYRINYTVKVYRLCGRRTYFVATNVFLLSKTGIVFPSNI